MANVLEYAKVFQNQLDKQVEAAATSGWMEKNAGRVQYNGGNEVKIPTINMDGLGDYDRNKGFVEGSVTSAYQTKTMTMDRGRTFKLDSMDVNETNFVVEAGAVLGEFQATKVVPELDAYRYSKIAALAIAAGQAKTGYMPDAETILNQLREDMYKIYDKAGDGISLVISISTLVAQILENSDKISKTLSVGDFKQGEVSLKVKIFDDAPLIRVPSARMKTEYLFKTGGTGQTEGGFTATETAKDINWIIAAQSAPIAVSKTDTVRIFSPDIYQDAHAWKIDYRKYHDLWIPDNKLKLVFVNTK